VAGRHINDHQVRLFMTNRRNDPVALAAAKAGFSTATGYRLLQSGELPSQRQSARSRRGPDPLAGIFEEIVVPMLEASPGLRPIAIFEELRRRSPETEFWLTTDAWNGASVIGAHCMGKTVKLFSARYMSRDVWAFPTLPA